MLSLIFFIDTNEGFLLQGARNKVPKFFCLKQILTKLSRKCPKKQEKKKDIKKTWRTIAQYRLKNYNKVWLLGSKIERNEGCFKTFVFVHLFQSLTPIIKVLSVFKVCICDFRQSWWEMAWKLRHTPDKSISKLLKLSSVGWESHLVSFPTPFYSLLCISHKNTSTHTHTQWHGRNIQNRLAPYSQLHGLWVLLSRHRGGRHLIHSCIKCWEHRPAQQLGFSV